MADDQSQRPYRSNEVPTRGPAAKTAGSVSGSDPLAELARLIGQSDPFSEFGREGARRAPPPAPTAADRAAPAQPATLDFPPPPPPLPASRGNDFFPAKPTSAAPPLSEQPMFGTANFGRQPFGSVPLAAGNDMYQVGNDNPAYAEPQGGFEHESYQASDAQPGQAEDDYYEDVPSNRRRIGIMAIAGVFALAVIGTAGAFGYRALFGSSSSTTPPPVIKADATPSKVVPATPGKDAQSSKLIVDRVNERGQGEKLVSRVETPVAINKPADVVFPQTAGAPAAASSPQPGSGVVGTEPKRIRTIAIHPDQGQGGGAVADPTPPAAPPVQAQAPASAPPPARITNINPVRQPAATQPTRIAPQTTADAAPPPVQRAAAPPVRVAAAPPANAPLSLSPESPPVRAAPAARTAAAAPPTRLAPAATSGGNSSYAVQVSSQRSEAEAQAAFQALQGRFPGQLGGKQAIIRRVDLGEKGIYFRAMVGPFGNGGDAATLCSSLKAAGGQCLVQKN